ncbi:pseudouridine synthase [Nocardia transvalensis]|uniref:pseudouridine synthase n=1 Tax=Nocardia transvalensis TaxID=37333 RepID=UPI001893CD52|nr:pseudouridine synthase [Nocardia transvalensis]MBF6332503.1 rRNA pseudouridine synthase [Nocardia transvalensis]
MNTPARRDGTPDRRKRRTEPPGGSARGRGQDRGGYGRTGDDRDSYGRGAGRGESARGGRGYGSGGQDRGGYGRDDRGGYGRGQERGGYGRGGRDREGYGRTGQDRSGYNRGDRDRGGYGGAGQSRGGQERGYRADSGRGGYGRTDQDRGGYGRAGQGRGGYAGQDRGGNDRGPSRSAHGRAPDHTLHGRSIAGKSTAGRIGGGRPLTPKPAPSRKPQRQKRQPTVLSFAKPARHQHVEPEAKGPKKLPWGEGERLQKVLAKAGVASRRAAEELIEQGRVEVDGLVVREQGLRIDPNTAVVRVDGVRVVVRDEQVYLALNKPKGFQSTMSDELGRPCIGDIVAERVMAGQRLFHVGRLDADTEGLLLLTNDGDLAHRLMHPSFEVSKTYLATVQGEVKREAGKRLRDGVELDDGPAKVDRFQVLEVGEGKSLVKVMLHEGRKHIVRRLLAEVGHPVIDLVRTHIGPIALGDQRPGSMRVLGRDEIGKLYEAVSL